MKFKVGDRAKVIKEGTHCQKIGAIVKILEVNTGTGVYYADCPYKGKWYLREDELTTVQFTKSDLKDGDIVTYRNGNQRTLKGDVLVDKEGFRVGSLRAYDNNLIHTNVPENSIVKVERPVQYETVFERKEEILDEAEKEYLKAVIRPFRDKVKGITKEECENKQYIAIDIKNDSSIDLPTFKKNTMYKCMRVGKLYSLEELGL